MLKFGKKLALAPQINWDIMPIYVHTYGTTTKIQMYLCKLVWKDQLSKTVINNLLGILVCYTTYKYKEFMDQ